MHRLDRVLIRNGKALEFSFRRGGVRRKRTSRIPRNVTLKTCDQDQLVEQLHAELPVAIKRAERGKTAQLAYIVGIAVGLCIPESPGGEITTKVF